MNPPPTRSADSLEEAIRTGVPSVREVTSEMMGILGGAKGFAAELVKDYHAAPAGSASRVRLGGMILDALKLSADMTGEDDAQELSDEDVEALARDITESADATE